MTGLPRVLLFGSPTWTNGEQVSAALRRLQAETGGAMRIVCDARAGAGALAARAARNLGYCPTVADAAYLDLADVTAARVFLVRGDQNPGTLSLLDRAKAAGVPGVLHRQDPGCDPVPPWPAPRVRPGDPVLWEPEPLLVGLHAMRALRVVA